MNAGNPPKRNGSRTNNVAFSVLLRGALPPTLVAGVLATIVIAIASGPRAGVSAAIGVAIVVGFFASGLLVVSRFVTDTANAMLFMAVGMAVYLAQVIVLLVVLIISLEVQAFDSRAAGVAMLVAIIVWQVAQMRAWRRARVPIYDEAEPPRADREAGA